MEVSLQNLLRKASNPLTSVTWPQHSAGPQSPFEKSGGGSPSRRVGVDDDGVVAGIWGWRRRWLTVLTSLLKAELYPRRVECLARWWSL